MTKQPYRFQFQRKEKIRERKKEKNHYIKAQQQKSLTKLLSGLFFFSLSIFSIAFTHKYTHIQTERMHINS